MNRGITPHETFEIHELLTLKNVCATKAAVMSSLVTDDRLKSILVSDVTNAKGHIKELQSLVEKSTFAQGLTSETGTATQQM